MSVPLNTECIIYDYSLVYYYALVLKQFYFSVFGSYCNSVYFNKVLSIANKLLLKKRVSQQLGCRRIYLYTIVHQVNDDIAFD